ncbi:hypothetical protein CEXT_292691 [Caerostris extrusa]|uniref:Uncharacterized protein n=1 Tax=Caerostris extrusa TaxID=172846 RepID=A0AAV4W7Q1_CAEEX|nr:hypothetical protein CEXT_292691 [Caerostris extrusa]
MNTCKKLISKLPRRRYFCENRNLSRLQKTFRYRNHLFSAGCTIPGTSIGVGEATSLSRLVRYVHLHINIENFAGVCDSFENIWLEIFPQESAYMWKRFHWSKTNTLLPYFISVEYELLAAL